MTATPVVAIICPDCDTRSEVPVADVAGALREHNRSHHDGRAVAHVAGGHVDRLRGDRV